MVIGAATGINDSSDSKTKKNAHEQERSFDRRFRELHGTILCRELLGIDLNTEEGQSQLREKNLLTTVCAKCVRDAAEILEELLAEE